MGNLNGYPRVIPPPTRVQLRRQRDSLGKFKVTLPVPPRNLRQSQPLPLTSIMEPTEGPARTLTPSDLYLSYAPIPRSSNLCQSQFFEKLGFKSADTSGDMRDKFIANMNDHVQDLSHKFLTKAANPEAFKILVARFLAKYGPIYWGNSERDHLEEQDIHRGFLCPRDTLRADSRLVAVVEGLFNYRAKIANRYDGKRATPLNRNLDFAALIGRKTDSTYPPDAVEPTTPNRSRRRCRPVVSDDEKSNEPTDSQDGDQPGTENSEADRLNEQLLSAAMPDQRTDRIHPSRASESTILPRNQSTHGPVLSLSSDNGESNGSNHTQGGGINDNTALSRHGSKRPRLSSSPHTREASQDTKGIKAHGSSPDPHPPNLSPIPSSRPEQDRSHMSNVINLDDSDDDEKQRKKRPKRSHSPEPTTLENIPRAKNEDLSLEITSRIKLRVNAYGAGAQDRGSIIVDFEVYKTSQRLFTALMSERNLKPDIREKISQLTVIIAGNKMCCRRDHWNDWSEVCKELRKLWDDRPELFNDRFVMDVVLHVDE